MEDLFFAAGVLVVLYLVVKKTSPQLVATQTPATAPPFAPAIPTGPVIIGDSYGVPPFATTFGAAGAVTPRNLPSTVNPPPGLPPPGGVQGGIGAGAGSGGLPLGGPLTPGVSTGTGGIDIFGRAYSAFGNPLPGYDIFGRPLAN